MSSSNGLPRGDGTLSTSSTPMAPTNGRLLRARGCGCRKPPWTYGEQLADHEGSLLPSRTVGEVLQYALIKCASSDARTHREHILWELELSAEPSSHRTGAGALRS